PLRVKVAPVRELDLSDALSRNVEYLKAEKNVEEYSDKIAAAEDAFSGETLENIVAPLKKKRKEWRDYRKGIVALVQRQLQSKNEDVAEAEQRKLDDEHRKETAKVRAEVAEYRKQEALLALELKTAKEELE